MYDLIIFDIDGVLTDGNLLFDGKGNYLKKINLIKSLLQKQLL